MHLFLLEKSIVNISIKAPLPFLTQWYDPSLCSRVIGCIDVAIKMKSRPYVYGFTRAAVGSRLFSLGS